MNNERNIDANHMRKNHMGDKRVHMQQRLNKTRKIIARTWEWNNENNDEKLHFQSVTRHLQCAKCSGFISED